ncbi:MAG: pilus assembly protein PilM [Candidatus Omnitrophota bacterium]|nr:pilus assembly protein PilM [Candidatus Omnitrophota bacterium]
MIVFEISNKTVKAVWGKSILPLKDIQISGAAYKTLPSDQPEGLHTVLSSIIDEKVYKKYKPLVLSIPRDQAILRNLSFPTKDESELENIIELHLTQEVPYSREEIIYDYTVLDKTASGFTNVLLSIVHRRTIVKQFAVFEKMNLFPDNVLLSTFGLMRFFQKAIPQGSGGGITACLDIDEEFTDFFLFKGDQILFSKSITIPASKLREYDKLPKFAGELKQAVIVAQSGRREGPSNVYVSGVSRHNLEFEKSVKNVFEIPPETLESIEVVGSLKGVKNIREIISHASLSSVIGIALNPLSARFRFTLPEAKMRKYAKDLTRNLFVTGGVALYIIVLTLICFIGKSYSRQAYLDKLQLEIRTIERTNTGSADSLRKIKVLRKYMNYEKSFLFFYYEISQVIPANITVSRIIFNKNKEFSVIGEGTDMGEIFKFVRILNSSDKFGKAELRYSRKASKGGKEFNEFNIVCHIE